MHLHEIVQNEIATINLHCSKLNYEKNIQKGDDNTISRAKYELKPEIIP